jgi:hypothetical protein
MRTWTIPSQIHDIPSFLPEGMSRAEQLSCNHGAIKQAFILK